MTDSIRQAKRAIHRLLLLRLFPMVIILMTLFAYLAYIYENATIDELVQDRAQASVAQILGALKQTAGDDRTYDATTMQQALNLTVASGTAHRWGYFPIGLISDTNGNILAKYVRDDFSGIEHLTQYLDQQLGADQRSSEEALTRLKIAGMPLVHVVMPLKNTQEETVARVEGLFALSEEAEHDATKRVLRTIFGALLIVLTTLGLLYPVMLKLLIKISRLTNKLLHSNLETLQVLGSAIAKRDSDTDTHNYRVTLFSVALAERVGLSKRQIRNLIKGAFLHDVGKIGIRDEVLLKPGKLDEGEFEVMKTHVLHGLDIVDLSGWLGDAKEVVGGHQEKYDGSGYCQGLKGDEIPISARIFTIADVFDALTSERPYKEPFPINKSMDILKEGSGSHFDPVLLEHFLEIAPDLYEKLSVQDDEVPKRLLAETIDRYFYQEIGQFITSA